VTPLFESRQAFELEQSGEALRQSLDATRTHPRPGTGRPRVDFIDLDRVDRSVREEPRRHREPRGFRTVEGPVIRHRDSKDQLVGFGHIEGRGGGADDQVRGERPRVFPVASYRFVERG
jgi:hypothetical protein